MEEFARSVVVSPVRLSAVAAVSAFIYLVLLNRGTWFFGDDYAVIVGRWRMVHEGNWTDALFSPHNEHPILPTAVVFLALQSLFGLHHPILFAMPMITAHVVIVFCSGLILTRHLRSRALAIAGLVALVFLSAGWENLLWTFQFGFVGAVALGFVHHLLVVDENAATKRLVVGAVAGTLGALAQGHGIVLVTATALVLMLQHRWRALMISVAPVYAVFLVWYVSFGRLADHPSATWRQRLGLPQFVWRGVVASFDGMFHLPGVGVLMVIGIGYALVRYVDLQLRWLTPLALAIAALAFYSLTGFARIYGGIDQAAASRYVYVGIVLLLPLVFVALDSVVTVGRRTTLLAAVLAAWLALAGAAEFREISLFRRNLNQQKLSLMSSAGELARDSDDERVLYGSPSPVFEPGLTVQDIVDLQDDGIWPEGHVNPFSLLRAATAVSLSFDPAEVPFDGDTSGAHRGVVLNGYAEVVDDDCHRIMPMTLSQLLVETSGDQPFVLTSDFPTVISVALDDPSISFRTDARDFTLDGATPYVVRGWLDGNVVVINLTPTSRYTVCGIDIR